MSRPSTLEAAAQAAYSRGADPLEFTLDVIILLTEHVLATDIKDPRIAQYSCQVVAAIMDLGWTMPDLYKNKDEILNTGDSE